MNARSLLFVMGIGALGCGKKAEDLGNTVDAVTAATSAAGAISEGAKEADKFYADRKAKGDTVAMAYTELEKSLPDAPSGYKADGGPIGAMQNMPGFSMSQAEQKFVGEAGSTGVQPQVKVTIIDLGGGQMGYSMMALPMMMGMSSEDDHHRAGTLKMSSPYTWGYEEFNKDSKESKVTLVTRYRYMVTIEATSQNSDNSAMVKNMAEEVAKKFTDK